jgi:hypothetical protein
MEGQDFVDVNHVLQKVVAHENRAKDHRSYDRFRESSPKEKERHNMSMVGE